MKRFAGAGLLDASTYVSDYIIPRSTVNECADEVQSRSRTRQQQVPSTLVGLDADGDVDATGDVQSDCAERWRNARPEAVKGVSWEALDETGFFACVCRHGFVFAVMDMVQSGELCVSSFLVHTVS